MYARILPMLAQDRLVIAVDLQAHGHTADVDRPLRFETLGDDVAALIGHLGLAQADVMGYSFGGATALRGQAGHTAESHALRHIRFARPSERGHPVPRHGITRAACAIRPVSRSVGHRRAGGSCGSSARNGGGP